MFSRDTSNWLTIMSRRTRWKWLIASSEEELVTRQWAANDSMIVSSVALVEARRLLIRLRSVCRRDAS